MLVTVYRHLAQARLNGGQHTLEGVILNLCRKRWSPAAAAEGGHTGCQGKRIEAQQEAWLSRVACRSLTPSSPCHTRGTCTPPAVCRGAAAICTVQPTQLPCHHIAPIVPALLVRAAQAGVIWPTDLPGGPDHVESTKNLLRPAQLRLNPVVLVSTDDVGSWGLAKVYAASSIPTSLSSGPAPAASPC